MEKAKVVLPEGNGVIDDIFVTPLGHLSIKVYFPEKKKWISYKLGIHDEKDNIFTKLLK